MEPSSQWLNQTLSELTDKAGVENLNLPSISSLEELKENLVSLITHLIDTDFEKLLWLLYRVDVDEQKAKRMLSEHLPADAPAVLADLIIQRQLKKAELKKSFEKKHPPDMEDQDLTW